MTGERAFEDLIREIDAKIEEAEDQTVSDPRPEILPLYDRIHNWEAMKIMLEAGIKWARRYARLARIIAENFETDPGRKEELLKVAETCERVPANPPRTLQESLQYGPFRPDPGPDRTGGGGPGRPDRITTIGPCYKKDVLDEKNITRDQAIELIGEFMIGPMITAGSACLAGARKDFRALPGPGVWTLGGVNKDGSDACNDLTMAFMQAARLVRVSNPTFSFRWHPKVKDEVMREIFECIRHGLGYPSMRNDPVLIANGSTGTDIRSKRCGPWVHQACMSPCPATKHGTQPMRMASVPPRIRPR